MSIRFSDDITLAEVAQVARMLDCKIVRVGRDDLELVPRTANRKPVTTHNVVHLGAKRLQRDLQQQ